jgi:hypothetical protein
MSMRSPSDLEQRGLVARAIDTTVTQPFGTYVFATDDPSAEIARGLERHVFLDAFGNTPELLRDEYEPYEPASFFVCVIDHRRKVCAAMMRIIVPIDHGPGLKSLHDVEATWGEPAEELLLASGVLLDASCTWDLATLAVDREYRSGAALGLMHIGLYQAVARLARYFEVNWLVAILDYPVYRLIRLQLRRIFVAYGDERSYLGSARSVPAYCPIRDAEREAEAADSSLHELIYVGSAMKDSLRQVELEPASEAVKGLFDKAASSSR